VHNLLTLEKSDKLKHIENLSNISHLNKENKLLILGEEVKHGEDALRQFCLDPEDAKIILQNQNFPLFDLSILKR